MTLIQAQERLIDGLRRSKNYHRQLGGRAARARRRVMRSFLSSMRTMGYSTDQAMAAANDAVDVMKLEDAANGEHDGVVS